MMEIQERVAEIEDKEALQDLLSEIQQRSANLYELLSIAFSKNDLAKVSELITELSYLQRVTLQATEKL